MVHLLPPPTSPQRPGGVRGGAEVMLVLLGPGAGGFEGQRVVLALPLVAHFLGRLFRVYFKIWPEVTRPSWGRNRPFKC